MPHLHFQRQVNCGAWFCQSIPIIFEETDGASLTRHTEIHSENWEQEPKSTPIACPDGLVLSDHLSLLRCLVYALNTGDLSVFEGLVRRDTLNYGTGFANGREPLGRTQFLGMLKERLLSKPVCEGYTGDDNYLLVWTSGWEPDWRFRGGIPSDVLTLRFMNSGRGLSLVSAYFTPAPAVMEVPSVNAEPCPSP